MGGGRTETHRDDEYLMSGAHDGATSATLRNKNADFASCGAMAGLYIENTTQSTNSLIASASELEITTDDSISWDKDDVYEIYKTGTKNSFISSQIVDLSRGWRTDPKDMDRGWKKEDIDIDRDKPGRVFGPGQPK